MPENNFVFYRREIRRRPPTEPAVAIRAKGGIVLTNAAYNLLTGLLGVRSPRFELGYCGATHTLAVRGTVERSPESFQVFHGQSLGPTWATYATSFFDQFGLSGALIQLERWNPAYVPDGDSVLHVPLSRPF